MRRSSLPTDEERRGITLAAAGCEIRADDAGTERFFGHAAVFDQRTAIGNPLRWGFYEEVAPGAFTKTIAEGDARMLIDHDSYYVVSRVSAGTLDLAADKIGLAVDSALDTELTYVNDLKANLRNKNVTGMSFGFYVVKDEWFTETVETSDGQTAEVEVRRILEVRLIEVSSCTFPAYEQTDAGLRATVRTALRRRGDADAIRRRTQYLPELAELLDEVESKDALARAAKRQGFELVPIVEDEPAETTRTDDDVAEISTTTDDPEITEPAASTRQNEPPIEARMRALAARFHLPA